MFEVGDKVKVKEDIVCYYNGADQGKGLIGIVEENAEGMYKVRFGIPINDYYIYSKIELELAPFTKSDLRDTDIVTMRNEESLAGTRTRDLYNDDLTSKIKPDYDIIKIERPTGLLTVFEREEKVKVSVEELIKCYEKVNNVKVEVE